MPRRTLLGILALVLAVLPLPALAMAVAPPAWQAPFTAFLRSATGPIAFGMSVVAIVGAGSVLLWGGEISEFVRRMVMLILVVGATMFSVAIVSRLFGGAAAVIPHLEVLWTP